jgi:type II secretory pathway component PulJ
MKVRKAILATVLGATLATAGTAAAMPAAERWEQHTNWQQRRGEALERRGQAMEKLGERLERRGQLRRGEAFERQGQYLERRGEWMEHHGDLYHR